MHLKNKIGILFSTLLLSCHQQKHLVQDQPMYWEGNQVSKQVYDSLLLTYTQQFVRNYRADTSTTSTPNHEN
uniref:hypothetical protein n=1 Tax=Algoriphagus sp. TaxID=1872435 RepID=UPI004047FC5B